MKEDELLTVFSENVRRCRRRLGLSQLALALKIGMSHNSINDIEKAKRWVSAKSLSKLSAALEVEPHVLLVSQESAKLHGSPLSLDSYHREISVAIQDTLESVKRNFEA